LPASPPGTGTSTACFGATAAVAARAGALSRLAINQLVEVAALPASGFFLVKQSQVLAIENLEELVPRNMLEGIVPGVTRKIEAQNVCAWDTRRTCAARFGPAPDFFMIGRHAGGRAA